MDTAAELAMLKAQMTSLMGAMQGEGTLDIKSVWAIHAPSKQAAWCSKSDCPKLGRKTTYDVVLKEKEETEDGELANIIKQGVPSEDFSDEDIERKVKRVGSPTVKLHDLGIIAAFTTKSKAQKFMKEYFESNQDQSPEPLLMTEIKIVA